MTSAVVIRGLPFSGFHDYEPVSPGSLAISRRWTRERNYLQGTAIDWTPTIDAAFREIGSECMSPNWDGPDSVAITEQVITVAQSVLEALYRMLPKGTSAPDVVPESDGEICINWALDASRVFAVSVGVNGRINFAGQFGGEGAIHGWEPIDTSSRRALETSLLDVVGQIERLYAPTIGQRAA